MKKYIKLTRILAILTMLIAVSGCQSVHVDTGDETRLINDFMDNWHNGAATANADVYFGGLNDNAIFIGTDALENWRKDAFFQWSKKYFERGKAWDFKAIDRNIFLLDYGKFAWFDELLDTPNLGICRGSGVLKKTDNGWKIEHYVLSITSPNETVDKVTQLNKSFEAAIKAKFGK